MAKKEHARALALPQSLLDRMANFSTCAPVHAWQAAVIVFGLFGACLSAELCTAAGCRPTGEPSLLLVSGMIFAWGMWGFNRVIEQQSNIGLAPTWRIQTSFWMTFAGVVCAVAALFSVLWITLNHVGVPGGAMLVFTLFEF